MNGRYITTYVQFLSNSLQKNWLESPDKITFLPHHSICDEIICNQWKYGPALDSIWLIERYPAEISIWFVWWMPKMWNTIGKSALGERERDQKRAQKTLFCVVSFNNISFDHCHIRGRDETHGRGSHMAPTAGWGQCNERFPVLLADHIQCRPSCYLLYGRVVV